MLEKDLLFTIEAQKNTIKNQEKRISELEELTRFQDEEIKLLNELKTALEEELSIHEEYLEKLREMTVVDKTAKKESKRTGRRK